MLCLVVTFSGCTEKGAKQEGARQEGARQEDYPITPVPFTSVSISDNFWGPRIKRNHEVTIPIAFFQSEITGRIKNFEVAGGLRDGPSVHCMPLTIQMCIRSLKEPAIPCNPTLIRF